MVWLASARRNQNQENKNFMTTKQAFVTEKLNEFWQAEVAPNVRKIVAYFQHALHQKSSTTSTFRTK